MSQCESCPDQDRVHTASEDFASTNDGLPRKGNKDCTFTQCNPFENSKVAPQLSPGTQEGPTVLQQYNLFPAMREMREDLLAQEKPSSFLAGAMLLFLDIFLANWANNALGGAGGAAAAAAAAAGLTAALFFFFLIRVAIKEQIRAGSALSSISDTGPPAMRMPGLFKQSHNSRQPEEWALRPMTARAVSLRVAAKAPPRCRWATILTTYGVLRSPLLLLLLLAIVVVVVVVADFLQTHAEVQFP